MEEARTCEVLNRLKSIEGHIRGIQRMVEDDQYCVDILNQTSAIHKALERVDVLILENHLQTCVTTAIRSEDPRERERLLRELLALFGGRTGSRLGRQLKATDLGAMVSVASGSGERCAH
jgi:CsoR family transcriptional regulator, copper-sensing transcriptional repressor